MDYIVVQCHLEFYTQDSESDSDDVIEVWKCKEDGCSGTIQIDTEKNVLVGAHSKHSCKPALKMEMNPDYDILDGYTLCKQSGNKYTLIV